MQAAYVNVRHDLRTMMAASQMFLGGVWARIGMLMLIAVGSSAVL